MRSRSKALLLVVGLVLVIAAVASESYSSPKAAAAPKMVMDSLEHDFGKVTPGTPLTYTFKLQNKGKAGLTILGVKPSCGCTKGDFDSLVAPNKSGKITLTIAKTEKYNGPIVKTATVTTNDPDHQSFSLTLRANFVGEHAAVTPAPDAPADPPLPKPAEAAAAKPAEKPAH